MAINLFRAARRTGRGGDCVFRQGFWRRKAEDRPANGGTLYTGDSGAGRGASGGGGNLDLRQVNVLLLESDANDDAGARRRLVYRAMPGESDRPKQAALSMCVGAWERQSSRRAAPASETVRRFKHGDGQWIGPGGPENLTGHHVMSFVFGYFLRKP